MKSVATDTTKPLRFPWIALLIWFITLAVLFIELAHIVTESFSGIDIILLPCFGIILWFSTRKLLAYNRQQKQSRVIAVAVSQEQGKLLKKIDNAGLYAISLAHGIFAIFVIAVLIFTAGQAGLDISMFKRLGITQFWIWILLLSYGYLNLKLGKKIRSVITKNTDTYLKWLLITAAIAFIFPLLGLSGLIIIFNLAILEVAWRARRALKKLSMDTSFATLVQKDTDPLTVAFLKKYAAYTVFIFLVVLGLELTFVRLHNQASVDPVQQSNRVTESAIEQTVTPGPQSTGRYDYLIPR